MPETKNGASGPQLDWKFGISQLAAIIGIVSSGFGAYWSLAGRTQENELRIRWLEQAVQRLADISEDVSELKRDIAVLKERVTRP